MRRNVLEALRKARPSASETTDLGAEQRRIMTSELSPMARKGGRLAVVRAATSERETLLRKGAASGGSESLTTNRTKAHRIYRNALQEMLRNGNWDGIARALRFTPWRAERQADALRAAATLNAVARGTAQIRALTRRDDELGARHGSRFARASADGVIRALPRNGLGAAAAVTKGSPVVWPTTHHDIDCPQCKANGAICHVDPSWETLGSIDELKQCVAASAHGTADNALADRRAELLRDLGTVRKCDLDNAAQQIAAVWQGDAEYIRTCIRVTSGSKRRTLVKALASVGVTPEA